MPPIHKRVKRQLVGIGSLGLETELRVMRHGGKGLTFWAIPLALKKKKSAF